MVRVRVIYQSELKSGIGIEIGVRLGLRLRLGLGLGLWLGLTLTLVRQETDANMAFGDGLVLLGATFYAFSNVGQEYVVKNFDTIEFLGFISSVYFHRPGPKMSRLKA